MGAILSQKKWFMGIYEEKTAFVSSKWPEHPFAVLLIGG